MYSIIQNGGKQYKVKEGGMLYLEKITQKVGEIVTFDQVLYANGVFGTPTIKGAKVLAKIQKHGREKKITIFKYKPKKKSTRKKMGHRQAYTQVLIEKIIL